MQVQGIISICCIVFGVIVLVVLTALGGVIKKTIDDSIYSRLVYKLPDGYKSIGASYQQCYRPTVSQFYNEYYMWNLTNPADFLLGSVPIYNLTGPWVYVQWYCNYDHSFNSTGILKYKTSIDGYMFLPPSSTSTSISNDDVLITNINPGYLGVLNQVGGSETSALMAATTFALPQFFSNTTGMQNATAILQVRVSTYAQTLVTVNAQVLAGVQAGTAALTVYNGVGVTNVPQFFSNSSFLIGPVFQGFAAYTFTRNPSISLAFTPTAMGALYQGVFTNVTALLSFASNPNTTVAATYGVTVDQADWLISYVKNYLLNPAPYVYVGQNVQNNFYTQWANPTNPTVLAGSNWEVGIPTATGISNADVAILFNQSMTGCALTNPLGFAAWWQGTINTAACGLSLNVTQVVMVNNWVITKFIPFAEFQVFRAWNITNWPDYSYAQWGSNVLGQALPTPITGTRVEYAPYPPNVACPVMLASVAKNLLVGPYGISNNITNMGIFLQMTNEQAAFRYSLDATQVTCLRFSYLYPLSQLGVKPQINATYIQGNSGLVVTRTVREWLMTAQDELVRFLGNNPNVAIVGNLTISKAQADAAPYTQIRVYTGDNDLHWSLMPINDQEHLPYWGGDVRVTGYNGSQFIPNYALDDANPGGYPLQMWNKLINRSVLFQNSGSDTWDGVNVRYLNMTKTTLASKYINPENQYYYNDWSGVINKTSTPPFLPVFLTEPDFHQADGNATANVKVIDNIFTDYNNGTSLSRHRLSLFILAEPLLGTAVWGNLPIQVNFKVSPTDVFYPNIKPHLAPIYWNAIGNKATTDDLNLIKNVLYAGQLAWKVLIGVGVGAGVIIMVGGIIGLHHYKKHQYELKESVPSNSVGLSSSG